MTKSVYLFSTKLRMFLSEIPLLLLLTVAIIYNDRAEGLLKLWPLIIAVSGIIIFIFLYFFRAVAISYEEIRSVGLFSSKEMRSVEKDRTIVLTVRSKNRLRVELFGKDEKPAFDWMKDADREPIEINLFNEKAVGSTKSVQRVLRFFGVPKEEFDEILKTDGFEKEYTLVRVTTETVNEEKKVKIRILQTV